MRRFQPFGSDTGHDTLSARQDCEALLSMRFQFWSNERARTVYPAWEYADAEQARLPAMQAVPEQVRAGAGPR